ncbi:MAG: hypothetical protein Q8N36_04850, partial [bacterium]|nr:hypothetical protein [bacterium]
MSSTNLVPKIPVAPEKFKAVLPMLRHKVAPQEPPESLYSWLTSLVKAGVKSLPTMAKSLGIQLGIVAAVNFILWPINTYKLGGFLAKLVGLLVFLTATYNDIIPKTFFWVIVFTFGKRLFRKIKATGIMPALKPIFNIRQEAIRTYKALQQKALTMLLLGGGVGLIIANNFASYSRFSGARYKIDKYFVVNVISFAVSYVLCESR